LTFVDVHHGTVSSCPVGEAEALVESAGGDVWFVDTDVHRVRAAAAGFAKYRLHERPP
jgi:hypothetical protein